MQPNPIHRPPYPSSLPNGGFAAQTPSPLAPGQTTAGSNNQLKQFGCTVTECRATLA